MTAFRAGLRIIYKHKVLIIAITVMLVLFGYFNFMNGGAGDTSFRSEKPSVTIINNDEGGDISGGLTAYLGKNCKVKKYDTKEALDDALFYRDVSYVITIPEGFSRDLLAGKDPAVETRTAGTSYGSLAGTLLQQYVRTVKVYSSVSDDPDEIVDMTEKSLEKSAKVKMDRKSDVDTNELTSAASYFKFENYIFLVGLVYVTGVMLMSFKEEETRRRILAGGMPVRKHDRQLILCCGLFALAFWGICTVMGFVLFRKAMMSMNGALFALNSFVFVLCALALSFMFAGLIKSRNALSGAMNVVSLGSSFICGAFVPLFMLPDGVVKAAHVLPSYWFVVASDEISSLDTPSAEALAPIFTDMGIVLGFAALFFALSQIFASKAAKAGAV